MIKNIPTDGIDDITLSDLKRGYNIYEGKRYSITSKLKRVKELRYGQLFRIPNSKGNISNTFSASSSARPYNRVWMKVPKGYRGWSETAPTGFVLVVPYDDPTGELSMISLSAQVLSLNVIYYDL